MREINLNFGIRALFTSFHSLSQELASLLLIFKTPKQFLSLQLNVVRLVSVRCWELVLLLVLLYLNWQSTTYVLSLDII